MIIASVMKGLKTEIFAVLIFSKLISFRGVFLSRFVCESSFASKVDFIVLSYRSFNNFESSLLLQFFKCYKTTKICPSMYDPYHSAKPHFFLEILCCLEY